jgi:hypothetical protein
MNIEASTWIEENYKWLVREFNNKWVGASAKGHMGSGESFEIALGEIQKRKLPLSEVVFIYVTDEPIQ